MDQEKIINEILSRSTYLHNKKSIKDELMRPVREILPHDGSGITTMTGTGLGLRGIVYDIPADYLIMWSNSRHEKFDYYSDFFTKGWKEGYHTTKVSAVDGFFGSPEYKERYEPYGLKDVIQTAFFDNNSKRLGIYACHNFNLPEFTDGEIEIFNSISPAIFCSFLKYRYLLELDFFGDTSYDDALYGVLTTTLSGEITYINGFCKAVLLKHHGKIPERLPPELEPAMEMVTTQNHKYCEGGNFSSNIESWTPYGAVIPLRCNSNMGLNLPVDEESLLFIIKIRYIDHEMAKKISDRELDIIKCLELGMTSKAIGERLFISERTVHTHIQNILDKLEAENRTMIISKAKALGLI